MTQSTLSIPDRLRTSIEAEDTNEQGYDELLDSLPTSVRNQVLDATSSKKEDKPKAWSKLKRTAWWIGLVLALTWAIPWSLLSLAGFVTIVGFPIGIAAWAIGSAPAAKLIEARVNAPTEKPWKRI